MAIRSERYGDNLHFQFGGYPVRMYWQGWETNSHLLEREGWEIRASRQENPMVAATEVRIAAISPDQYVFIQGMLRLSHQEVYDGDPRAMFERGLRMQHTNVDQYVMTQQNYRPEDIEAMDKLEPITTLVPCKRTLREIILGKNPLFQEIDSIAHKDIIIPDYSVDECLDMILKLQYPEQQIIKNEERLRASRPLIQAQIYSLDT